MKKLKDIRFKSTVVVLSLLLFTAACEKWTDPNINIDPDAAADVPMNLLLPAIQQSMGYNLVGNNTVRTNNIWMQQFDGTDRQSYTEARYQLTPADVGNAWTPMYTEIMMNSTLIVNKAKTEGVESPNFAGVAQVCIATTLGIGTDLFGDMPYSEAFQGSNNVLKPVYDPQQSVYTSINTLLDEAITNLNSTTNAIPISGDVIYNGSAAKWKKAAYSIKARHALQRTGRDGNAAYSEALAAVTNGFASNADDFLVPFEDSNRNPIFQFVEQRTDIRMGATLVDMMAANNDPRLPFYAAEDADGNYTGSVIGSQNGDASLPGPNVAAFDASVKLMTYSELKFIEAEARLVLGQGDAQAAYEAAVAASVLRITGAANTAWLTANIIGDPVTLEKIITQKYIDGFGTNQPYADYRRTGFPTLTLHPDAVINEIPSRFPYPQAELDYNTANVPAVTLTTKLWWDN